MLQDICSVLRQRIETLPYFDRVGGLVKVQEEKVRQGDPDDLLAKVLVMRYPVTTDMTDEYCKAGGLRDLVPDSTKSGIAYFEATKATRTGKRFSFGEQWVADVRLVCWLNVDYITGNGLDYVNADIMTDCMVAIGGKPIEAAPYKMVRPTFTGIMENDPAIFSKYTYDTAETQFLMAPFAYFAVDMSITFIPPRDACYTGLQLNVKQC